MGDIGSGLCMLRNILTNIIRFGAVIFVSLMMMMAIFSSYFELRAQWHDGLYKISSLTHEMPEVDYSLLWAAGKLASTGHASQLYDGPSFATWRRHLFGDGLQRLDWLYPPPMVALGMAVSRLPLLPGYFLWMALVCVISMWALRGAGLSWRVVLLGFFGPPMWRGLAIGQIAPLAASLVAAGLLEAKGAPVRAGIKLALATLKAHLGVLVPVVWLAQRRWPAFCVATIGTIGLAALSTAVLGFGMWATFLHGSGVSARALVEAPTPSGFPLNAASVFWMARSFSLSIELAYAAQITAAIAATFSVWMAARFGNDTAAAAVTICLIPLVSPYLYASDLVGYSIVVAMLAERQPVGVLPIALWLCPGVSEAFAWLTGKAILPAVMVVAAALAWREFQSRQSSENIKTDCAGAQAVRPSCGPAEEISAETSSAG